MPFSTRSRRWLWLAVLVCVCGWRNPGHAAEPLNATQQYVGIGLGGFSYWDGGHALADLQGQSRYVNFSWGLPLVDANGWPQTDVRLLVSSDALAAGTYKIVLSGQVQTINPSAGAIANLVYNSAGNQTTADWVVPATARGNIWIDFTNTRRQSTDAAGTGFVNLHIWRPGMPVDGSVRFTPEFLAAAKKFGVLRGMDMVGANGNPAQHWSDRSLMQWAGEPVGATNSPWGLAYVGTNTSYNGTATNTYWPGGYVSDRGRPWELLVLIANVTTNDLWLNLPVRVDDDYVTKLAQLIRYGSDGVTPYTSVQANPVYPPLASNLKVYFEYGNEVWNTGPGFNCFYWEEDIVSGLLGDSNQPICYDGNPGLWTGMSRYTAYRSATMSLIFRQVFGDAAMMTRVRPILASQVGNANGILQTGLQWAEGFYGMVRSNNPTVRQVSDLWYGGGGAAYYDSTVEPFVLSTNVVGSTTNVTAVTTPALMTAYFNGLPNAGFAAATATDATWTKAYGLKLTAYEGGPGPGGSSLGGTSGSAVSPLYNADPRMKDRMLIAQNIWIANGGDLLTYYALQGDGPWGFGDSTNTVMTTNTIKLQAIDAMRAQAKTNITLGTLVPATIPTTNNSGAAIIFLGGYTDASAGTFNINANADPVKSGALLIPIHTTVSGTYKFQLGYKSAAAATVELLLNGQSVGIWTLAPAGSLIASARIITNLTAGSTVARVRVLTGGIAIHDFTVLDNFTADAPTFSPNGGTYNISQTVTLSSTTPNASIYYTINGSTPSPTNGTLYTAPVELFTSTTIKAMAVAGGFTNSPVSSASFTINNINYGTLVGWDFTGAGGPAATNGNAVQVDSTYNASGVQPSQLTRGSGAASTVVQAVGYIPIGGAMNTTHLSETTLAAAKTAGGYFQFTVAPVAGHLLSLSALNYCTYQQGTGAAATFVVEYSTNSFLTGGVPVATNSSISSAWSGRTNHVDLSAISGLQQVANPLTFRLWGYGFATYEDKGLGQVSGNNLDVGVMGTVTAVSNLLGAQRIGGSVQLTWSQGMLLQADQVTGPWTTNASPSPCLIIPDVPQRFYRVQLP